MPVNLYWNNICLVTKLEEKYITDVLAKHDPQKEVKVTYFGLGRKESLLSHFVHNETIDADIMVTTDTDIIHDHTFAPKLLDFSSPSKFITIPLVIVYNKDALSGLTPPQKLSDLFKKEYHGLYSFGGPTNSAGKSLVKSLWSTYGYEKASTFVENAVITSMPAAAFHEVMTGTTPIAIVPTIFSLRAGIGSIHFQWPKDGAIPIHSYIVKRKNLHEPTIISEHILGKDLQQLLVNLADILPHHNEVSHPTYKDSQKFPMMEPTVEFLRELDHQKLYTLLHI